MAEARREAPPQGVPSPWAERYPPVEAVTVERNKVSAAAIVVVAVSLVQGLIAVEFLPNAYRRPLLVGDIGHDDSLLMTVALFAKLALSLVAAGWMARRQSALAAWACLALSALGAALMAVAGAWLGLVLDVGAALIVANALIALGRLRRRYAQEAERNPKVQHYRLLVSMLARTMAADGHLDRRELDAIMRICDSLRISRGAQRQFLEEALDELESDRSGLEALATSYLELAERAGLPHARQTALMAALAVASADGVIGKEEEAELNALGRALKVEGGELEGHLAAHRAQLAQMDRQLALQMLRVEEGATDLELDLSYRHLLDDLGHDEEYGHLGQHLGDYAKGRRDALNAAYGLLREKP